MNRPAGELDDDGWKKYLAEVVPLVQAELDKQPTIESLATRLICLQLNLQAADALIEQAEQLVARQRWALEQADKLDASMRGALDFHAAAFQIATEEARTGRFRQRAIAKKPRPRAASVRTLCIDAMRKFRRSHQATLNDFLAAAAEGSVSEGNISAACEDLRGVVRWTVFVASIRKEQQVAVATLGEWWSKAA